MKSLIFNISLVLTFFYTTSCKTGSGEQSKVIDPPIEKIQPGYMTAKVEDASAGKTIVFASGTTVTIPANAFVDKDGKTVSGEVEIALKEFHTAADVILSGIPMSYDTAGTEGNFQTAGMFDIKGFKNTEPVFIAKDKSLGVNLSSYVGGTDYNFYDLDEESGKWAFKGTNNPEKNLIKQAKLDSLPVIPEQPVKPGEYNPDAFVFDINVNLSNYPELSEFKNIMWQYAGTEDETNPEKNKWIFNERWTEVVIKSCKKDEAKFRIVLSNKKKNFETDVTPVLKGKNLEKAMERFDKKFKEYELAVEERKNQEEKLKKVADFYRYFRIQNFGVYNYDRLYHNPNSRTIIADFKYEGKSETGDKSIQIYMVTGEDRVVIKYPFGMWEKFVFIPNSKNKIIALLPNNKVAYVNSAEMGAMDLETIKMTENKYTFNLKTSDQTLNSPTDLQSVIESL